MPHFIITYGPTGSGKGYLKEKFLSKLQMEHPEVGEMNKINTYFAEVDDYIEGNTTYKLAVFDVLKHFYLHSPKNENFDEYLRRKLIDFVNEDDITIGRMVSDKMFEAYNSVKDVVKDAFMNDLKQAIDERKHIVYELTGSKGTDPLGKFFSQGGLLDGITNEYVVTIVFPYVDDKVVIHRATERFLQRVVHVKPIVINAVNELSNGSSHKSLLYIRHFMENVPPRLPDILELRKEKISVSQENLVQYINHNHIQNVLVYDNNVSKLQIGDFNLSKRDPNETFHKKAFVKEYGNRIHPMLMKAIASSSARVLRF